MSATSVHRLIICNPICLLIIFALFLLPYFCPAALADSGDAWIYGDAPVPNGLSPCQYMPDISGDIAVWVDRSLPSHIYYKDISSPDPERPLSESPFSQDKPRISNNVVVWSEKVEIPSGPYSKVYYKYLDGSGPFAVTDLPFTQSDPYISGNRIVWVDSRNGYGDIYMLDLTSGEETAVVQRSGTQFSPAIDGDWIIWRENYLAYSYLYARNIVTGEQRQISSKVGGMSISGDNIVYSQFDSGQGYNLYIYNLQTMERRDLYRSADFSDSNADIDGDKVVWTHMPNAGGVDNTRGKVFVHDLTKNITLSIESSVGGMGAKISGNRIVWTDFRSQNCGGGISGDIYQSRFSDLGYGLVMKYRPELHLAKDENFGPMPVEQFLTAPETFLRKRNDPLFRPRANPTAEELASFSQIVDLYIDLPGKSVRAGVSQTSCEIDRGYINEQYTSEYVERKDQFPATIYARMVPAESENGNSAIQYWIQYYANDHPELFHEGDWELVQVDLNENSDPVQAAYSHHGGGTWRPWDAVEGPDSHPIVYVAAGSHANYFHAGDKFYIFWPLAWDVALGDGEISNPSVKLLPDPAEASGTEFDWLNFRGQWGEFTGAELCTGQNGYRDGPDNPTVQNPWNDPFSWASQCDGCEDETADGTDVQLTAKSPVDIHIYDTAGRHVGKNDTGGIDTEIPGSEYLEYPGRKSIIIHGADESTGLSMEANGTGTGICEIILTAPDHSGGTVDTLRYQSIQVNPATEAMMTLDASKNYTLSIDPNGDGNITQKPPDVSTKKDVDFNAPAQVTDLASTGTNSGAVTLGFTAPGDDISVGTASSYDLRYSKSPLTDENWKDAIPATSPVPQAAGSAQSVTILGLDAGTTYYFALRTLDDVALSSPTSNTASATTTIPDLTWSIIRIYWANWTDYQNRHLSIDYRMDNSGTAAAFESTVQASLSMPNSVHTVTNLPLLVGDMDPASNRIVTLKYYVPTNVGSFTAMTYATCNDDAGRQYWFPGPLS